MGYIVHTGYSVLDNWQKNYFSRVEYGNAEKECFCQKNNSIDLVPYHKNMKTR